ncbi:MAG: outer membrane lipid asymmetry maintenance protein MlaD [Pseudomonadota bacterium]
MASNTVEALIGAVVLSAAGGFLVYAANTANISGGGGGYELVAEFGKAEGISPGGDVRMAGVKIGSITKMELDPQSYDAVVRMTINSDVLLPDDSDVKITSASLLGDSYLLVQAGGSEFMFEDGGVFLYTQDSITLMDLVSKFIAGTGG